MQRIIDLIEATLDAEISPEELAERAGYSLWHFLHLFREATGMPLNRWRMRRRLAHAIWHVSAGMRVTDAALRWGFGTHSGFYRAFRREYGCTPAEFIRRHRVRRPSPPRLKEEMCMLTREGFREALTHWNLDLPLTPVTYPHSGEICEHVMLAGADHVLRLCSDDHACRMAAAVADALAGRGLPAAQAIPLPDGALCLPVAGGCVMLQRRLPGEPLRTPDLLAAPVESGLTIGRALAGLHLALADLPEEPLVDALDMGGHLLDWAYPRAKDFLPPRFPADFGEKVAQLGQLPQAVIHRDPNPSNLIGTPAGIGFVDFALSVQSCRIFDPCYMATAVLSESYGRDNLPWEKAWPAFARAVLEGYDEVSPLTQAEWHAAPMLMLGNELLALAAFADSSRYREVFETNRNMLAWMTEHMPL
ncbi:MAG: helix-turn-helix domain-containing protein [Clostridia bacterium]|nr:helix-turn-helix domain-containing protein [Clostridia bacterium]